MNKKLKQQLNTAFYAPEPVKKDSFLKKLRPREITTTEMIFQQLPYIRKTIWLMAVAVLTVAVIGSYVASENTVRVIEALAPLAAVSACLEMQRSYRYQMTELEMATRFSVRSVLLARMLIVGTVYMIVFCVIAPVLSVRFGTSVINLASRILIPYLLTVSICLHIERTEIGRKNRYLSMAIACLISVSVFWIGNYDMPNITGFITSWGPLMIVLLVALTVYENYKTVNTMEEFA